jgi:NAD(P)-dependent dehydrogenase (short-subunit alcohol dehydrogenase family)
VNVASISGVIGPEKFPGFVAYCASKAAVLSITRSLAFALADRSIRVNSVSPGIIDTPMQDIFLPQLAAEVGLTPRAFQARRLDTVPLRRIGAPDEVAAVIAFLLSSDAAYVTGEDVNVSAGLVTW